MFAKSILLFLAVFLLTFAPMAAAAPAGAKCPSLEEQPIKIDAWVSRKFKKQKKAIKKEMGSMEHVKVRLRVFSMTFPAKVMAIGRCVPVKIGQHALRQALKYTGGIKELVNQQFLAPYWIGIGTMNFDEYSQRPVNADQVNALLDDSLTTEQFQDLYQKLSRQKKRVKGFGAQVPNPRKVPE